MPTDLLSVFDPPEQGQQPVQKDDPLAVFGKKPPANDPLAVFGTAPDMTPGLGIAARHRNPGNIREGGDFKTFASPEEGFQALKEDVLAKQTGNNSHGLGPTSSLYDFFNVYAPPEDHNDPKAYAEAVAARLGIAPTDPIGGIDTEQFAKEIARHEDPGYAKSLGLISGEPVQHAPATRLEDILARPDITPEQRQRVEMLIHKRRQAEFVAPEMGALETLAHYSPNIGPFTGAGEAPFLAEQAARSALQGVNDLYGAFVGTLSKIPVVRAVAKPLSNLSQAIAPHLESEISTNVDPTLQELAQTAGYTYGSFEAGKRLFRVPERLAAPIVARIVPKAATAAINAVASRLTSVTGSEALGQAVRAAPTELVASSLFQAMIQPEMLTTKKGIGLTLLFTAAGSLTRGKAAADFKTFNDAIQATRDASDASAKVDDIASGVAEGDKAMAQQILLAKEAVAVGQAKRAAAKAWNNATPDMRKPLVPDADEATLAKEFKDLPSEMKLSITKTFRQSLDEAAKHLEAQAAPPVISEGLPPGGPTSAVNLPSIEELLSGEAPKPIEAPKPSAVVPGVAPSAGEAPGVVGEIKPQEPKPTKFKPGDKVIVKEPRTPLPPLMKLYERAVNEGHELKAAELVDRAERVFKKYGHSPEFTKATQESIDELSEYLRVNAGKREGAGKIVGAIEPGAAVPEVKLPAGLAGAKPRYAYGGKQFELNFESDLDKAAYISAQAAKSKADAAYVKFVMDHTGHKEETVRTAGQTIRTTIKGLAKDAEPGVLTVPAMGWNRPGGTEMPAKAPGTRLEQTVAGPTTVEAIKQAVAKVGETELRIQIAETEAKINEASPEVGPVDAKAQAVAEVVHRIAEEPAKEIPIGSPEELKAAISPESKEGPGKPTTEVIKDAKEKLGIKKFTSLLKAYLKGAERVDGEHHEGIQRAYDTEMFARGVMGENRPYTSIPVAGLPEEVRTKWKDIPFGDATSHAEDLVSSTPGADVRPGNIFEIGGRFFITATGGGQGFHELGRSEVIAPGVDAFGRAMEGLEAMQELGKKPAAPPTQLESAVGKLAKIAGKRAKPPKPEIVRPENMAAAEKAKKVLSLLKANVSKNPKERLAQLDDIEDKLDTMKDKGFLTEEEWGAEIKKTTDERAAIIAKGLHGRLGMLNPPSEDQLRTYIGQQLRVGEVIANLLKVANRWPDVELPPIADYVRLFRAVGETDRADALERFIAQSVVQHPLVHGTRAVEEVPNPVRNYDNDSSDTPWWLNREDIQLPFEIAHPGEPVVLTETDGLGPHFGTMGQAADYARPQFNEDYNPRLGGEVGRFLFFAADIRNPVILPDLGTWRTHELFNALEDAGVRLSNGLTEQIEKMSYTSQRSVNRKIKEELLTLGIDAIAYLNKFENVRGGSRTTKDVPIDLMTSGWSYIVFRPEAIKSLAGNVRYDPSVKDVFGGADLQILQSIVGSGVGGFLGAVTDKKHPLRGAAIGFILGAGLGAKAGKLATTIGEGYGRSALAANAEAPTRRAIERSSLRAASNNELKDLRNSLGRQASNARNEYELFTASHDLGEVNREIRWRRGVGQMSDQTLDAHASELQADLGENLDPRAKQQVADRLTQVAAEITRRSKPNFVDLVKNEKGQITFAPDPFDEQIPASAPEYTKRIMSRVVPNPSDKSIFPSQSDNWTWADWFFSHFKSSTHWAGKVEGTIGKELFPLGQSPREWADRFSGSPGRGQIALETGNFIDWDSPGTPLKKLAKGYKEILAPFVGRRWQLTAYELARETILRAARNTSGRPSVSGIELNDAIRETMNASPEVKQAADDATRYRRAVLWYLQRSGMFSKAALDHLENTQAFYVMMTRILEGKTAESLGQRVGAKAQRVLTTVGAKPQVKQFVGSLFKIVGPEWGTVDQTRRFFRAADLNRVAKSLVTAAELEPELMRPFVWKSERQVVELDRATSQQAAALKLEAENRGVEMSDDVAKELALGLGDKRLRSRSDKLHYWRDGKLEVWNISPEGAAMFKAFNPSELNIIVRGLGFGPQLAKQLITDNPAFAFYNAVRDTQDAAIQSQYGFVPGWSSMKGFAESLSNGKFRQEMLAATGSAGGIGSRALGSTEQATRAILPKTAASELIGKIVHPLDALRAYALPFEEAARIGEFMLARKAGAPIAQAAVAADKVTTNFKQMGLSMRGFSHMVMFANPAIQSLGTNIQAFRERPAAATLKALGTITLPSVLFWAANRDDKEIQEARKTRFGSAYWYFRVPFVGIARWPKGFLYGQIFGTSIEDALDKAFDNDPTAGKRFLDALWSQTAFNVIPNTLDYGLGVWVNKDFSTGSDIAPKAEGNGEVSPRYQTNARVGPTADWLGDMLNVSPAKIDFSIRTFLGTLGQDALRAIDMANDAKAKYPTPMASELPIIGRLLARYPTESAYSLRRFYDDAQKSEVAVNDIKLMELKHPERVKAYADEHRFDFSASQVYADTRKTLSDIRGQIDLIQSVPEKTLSSDRKRELINKLMDAMIRVARQVNEGVQKSREKYEQ